MVGGFCACPAKAKILHQPSLNSRFGWCLQIPEVFVGAIIAMRVSLKNLPSPTSLN